jgi:hypothetical protein
MPVRSRAAAAAQCIGKKLDTSAADRSAAAATAARSRRR